MPAPAPKATVVEGKGKRVVVYTGDDERNDLVGHNLRAYIEDLEKRMREAAADLDRITDLIAEHTAEAK